MKGLSQRITCASWVINKEHGSIIYPRLVLFSELAKNRVIKKRTETFKSFVKRGETLTSVIENEKGI
jgi:hypothetical protein